MPVETRSVTIKNLEEELQKQKSATKILEKQIKVECPKMLFPYIRRIISQTMIESGMPNIDIKNINFFDLYRSNNID